MMPSGQLTIAETSIVAGATFNNSNRYGDYNALVVDPADGTTFWGTSNYNPTTSPTNNRWATRMFKFSFAPQNVSVAPRVLLEGPYAGAGLMSDALRSANYIPTAQPFTGLGYSFVNGGGSETTTASGVSVTGSNAIVDWVLVELRNSAAPATVITSRAALLQRNGDIVGTDGTSALIR